MVWIKSDPSPVLGHIHDASEAAAKRVLVNVQTKLKKKSVHPYATGKLANSYRIERVGGDTWAILSELPYAHVIERGAWVEGKGPHVSGSGNLVGIAEGGKRTYTGKGRDEVKSTIRSTYGRNLSAQLKGVATGGNVPNIMDTLAAGIPGGAH